MAIITLQQILDRKREVEKLCRENGIEFLGVFGSTVRGENRPDSDVDLLVRFKPATKIGFFEWVDIERRFSERLGKKTDLVIQDALKPLIKDRVYSDLRVIYGQP